jgi:hypothetical protein
MARRWRALAGALVALAAACLAACGAGAGSPSSDARLLVTADFGNRVLVRADAPEVRGADTVMRLVQRNAKVTTRYGGGFVQSIDGLAGGQRGGRPVDWFFYVDGVLSERGAAQVRVADGDAVWWDHHDWGSGPGSGSAVVGAFPAPFTSRAALACIPASAPACATTRTALTRAGARVESVAPSALGRGDVPGVLVGTAGAIRDTRVGRLLRQGPEGSGVYARPVRDGRELALLDQRGHRVRASGAGTGLVAATRTDGQAPVWAVTGTDDAGVQAAAGALTQDRLATRFAVAVEGEDTTPLPLEPGR